MTNDKRLRFIFQVFGDLVEQETIPKNPFRGVSIKGAIDESRNVRISREVVYKVMEHAPDAEFRLVIALSRFAGLRCPSETHRLEWRHIDWKRRRITVPSPKTKRHQGKGQREIPLYDVLVDLLLEAEEQSAGGKCVIQKHRSLIDEAGGSLRTNMGVRLKRIIHKAGLQPWRDPCHTDGGRIS